MSLLSNIIAVAKSVAEQFVPGVAEFETAADAVFDLVTKVGPILSSDDQAALADALEADLAAMNRDVDGAVKALRGGS